MSHNSTKPIITVIIKGPYDNVILTRTTDPLNTFTFWKFPERDGIDGMSYRETAFKIVTEEIGIFIPPGNLSYLGDRKSTDKAYLFFEAFVRNFEGLKEDKELWEIMKITSREIPDMKDIYPFHAKTFKEFGLAHQ